MGIPPGLDQSGDGVPSGLDFPVIPVRDMVRAQAILLDPIGIESCLRWRAADRRHAVLQWAAGYRSAYRGFADRGFDTTFGSKHRLPRGRPPGSNRRPDGTAAGISLKAPIRAAASRFRASPRTSLICPTRRSTENSAAVQDRDNSTFSFDADFQVELPICATRASFRRALQREFVSVSSARHGLFRSRRGLQWRHGQIIPRDPTRFCVISFTSDWLFPTSESRALVHALNAAGARVSFAEITTDKGHNAFLLDEPELFTIVRGFLEAPRRRAACRRR